MRATTPTLTTGISAAALATALFLAPATAAAQSTDAPPATADERLPQPVQPTDPATTEPVAADGGDTIIVTGTRIRRPEAEIANPVASFDNRTIVLSGKTNLTEFLQDTPALSGSSSSQDNAGNNAGIGATGLNLLNLRNLGEDRTLVLVDGRRHVSAVPGSAAIDINTIPTDLVERVDVVTGGASAVYGADGVSGVVNFILKRDFEGLAVRGQAGISERGDAGNRFVSITGGTNFADDRGNVALSYEYSKEDRLVATTRPELIRGGFYRNPADGQGENDNPNIPDLVFQEDVRFFDSSRYGALDLDFDGVPDINPDGTAFDGGTFLPPFYQIGGDATPVRDYSGDFLPDLQRHAVNGLFRFALTDSINFFAQGKYVETKAFSTSQPTFDFYIFVAPDNPFLPAAIRDAVVANGGALLNRDNFDLGVRGERIKRETIRSVVGFDGDLTDDATFELSYTFGQSKARNARQGNRYNDRFLAALDAVRDPATGNIVCRSTLDPTAEPLSFGTEFPGFLSFRPGAGSPCVALNPFGENNASQAAIDFVTTTSIDTSRIRQHVVTGSISGDFGDAITLPGGGEPAYALGVEYRKESSRSTPAPEDTSGATFGNQIFPSRGSFDVKEAFAELSLPLLQNLPGADELTLGAAIRLSDYSTVGKTTTWKVDGVYAPLPDIKFRATYAQAVRAPNIGELFSAQSQTFAFIADPCAETNINDGTDSRAANCRTLLAGLGVADPENFIDRNSASIPGFVSGNRNLDEETAKTITAGVVIQPRFIRGLTLTADWYDIKLTDAISTVSAQQLAELCVDQPSLDNQFCGAITRESGGTRPGRISGFTVQPVNVANFRTRGVDMTANYRFTLGTTGINLRAVAGYLDELTFIGIPGSDPIDSRNLPGAPKWLVNFDATVATGPLTVNYGLNWNSRTFRFDRIRREAQPDVVAPEFFRFRERWEHDLAVSYDVNEQFSFYGGVNNFTDEKPDIGAAQTPVGPVGRRFYVGASVRFGGRD